MLSKSPPEDNGYPRDTQGIPKGAKGSQHRHNTRASPNQMACRWLEGSFTRALARAPHLTCQSGHSGIMAGTLITIWQRGRRSESEGCANALVPTPEQYAVQARAAGLPLAVSRMPATMLLGTGSKRNGSIEYAARPLDSERIAVA